MQPYLLNIVPCQPGEEEKLAKGAIDLEVRTGISLALYSLTLHPEGFPASRKAEFLLESYRRFARALSGSRVQPGVLLQSILGHWPRVDKEEEKWQRTIDCEGNPVRFCPLDEGFRNYIRETIAALAKEHPAFILGDDDIRSFSPHAECFCPLHTAEFNRRTGRAFSPEEYREAVRNCAVGDEVFQAYEQLRQDTVNGVCRLIREAIDSVDPAIPAGTCMPYWEIRFNGNASCAIAGKGQAPIMRIASGSYMEESALPFAENHLRTMAYRLFYKDLPVVLDEADTCPHNLYSKSARSLHTKLCSAFFAGLNGAKLWFLNGFKFGHPVSPKYTEELEKNRLFDQTLFTALQGCTPKGVILPMHDRFPLWHPVNNPGENFVPQTNWCQNMLGVYGIPFRPSFDLTEDGIYAVAGKESIDRLTDEQLRTLLSRRLLLDGEAAVALTQRGFAEFLGCTAEAREFRYNRELSADGKRSFPFSKTAAVPFLTALSPDSQALSHLYYAPFSSAPEAYWERIAPSTVFFRNALGGLVCTTAWHSSVLWGWASEARKDWLVERLDALGESPLPFLIEDYQWVMLLHRRTKEQHDLLGLFHLSFDPLEQPRLRCARKPAQIEQLSLDGSWSPLPFTWDGQCAILPLRLECYDMTALRIRE